MGRKGSTKVTEKESPKKSEDPKRSDSFTNEGEINCVKGCSVVGSRRWL